jgi:hypothetical protein
MQQEKAVSGRLWGPVEAIGKSQIAPQGAIFRRPFGHHLHPFELRQFVQFCGIIRSFAGLKTEYFQAPAKLIEPGTFQSVSSRI